MATYNNVTNFNEFLAREMGYRGNFGDGSAQAWLESAPGRLDEYNRRMKENAGHTMTSAELSKYANIGAPISDNRYNLIKQMGYTGENNGTAIDDWLATQGMTGGGVAPVGFVEPLNDWQKQGLTTMAGGFNEAKPLFDIGRYMVGTQAVNDLKTARAPITADEYKTAVEGFMNPYLDQVLNRTTAGLDEAGAEARARLMASQGFRKAFGDTSLGVQGAELDKNLINSKGDAIANLSYAGYNDAGNRALETLNGNRNRALNVAAADLNTGNTIGNYGTLLEDRSRKNALGQIQAGDVVQNQNQKTLDILRDQIMGVTNYDDNRLKELAGYLSMIPGSTYSNSTSQSPNTASRLGNVLTMAGGVDWSQVFGGA